VDPAERVEPPENANLEVSAPERAGETAVMPSTHTSLHYHAVFSTKNREPWISPSSRSKLHAYLGGIGLRQEEHHRKASFEEEYVAMLKRGMVEYDESYLW
jgi:hypothetical protein